MRAIAALERSAMLTLDSALAISPHAVFREMDGEAVILDLESGTYFGLNGVGTRMWQLIEEDGRLRVVFDRLADEFDVAGDRLEQDLLDLVSRLVDKGLVGSSDAPAVGAV